MPVKAARKVASEKPTARKAKPRDVAIEKEARRWRHKKSPQDQLLEAASDLMIEKGTIEISLGEIARKAELNSALVAYYFGGKDGLLMALVKRNAFGAVKGLHDLDDIDLGPEEKLKKHLAGVINFHFRYPYTTRLMHFLMRDPDSKNSREITRLFSEHVTRTEARILEDGAKAGLFRKIDPVLFYFSALGACDYLFWGSSALHFMFGLEKVDDAMRRRFIEHTIELFLKGCLVQPENAKPALPLPRPKKTPKTARN